MPGALLTLPATLDIKHVGDVASQLQQRIRRALPVRIDASGVTHTDTAGLQLLLAARLAARTGRLAFEWAGVSTDLRAIAAILGLAQALDLP